MRKWILGEKDCPIKKIYIVCIIHNGPAAPALTHANIQKDLNHFQREAIPYFDKKIKDIQRKLAAASKTRSVMMKRKGVLPASVAAHDLYIRKLQNSLKMSMEGRAFLKAKVIELRKLNMAASATVKRTR